MNDTIALGSGTSRGAGGSGEAGKAHRTRLSRNAQADELEDSGDAYDQALRTFRTLTPSEAEVVRRMNPPVSPWRVVAAQAAAGLVCTVAAWAFLREAGAVWSALYGAAAAVLPSALLARGMTRGTRGAVAAAAGFMFWEMLKIGVAIAMLLIAAQVVPRLSWPVLLATMAVCIKMNWVALLWRGR